MNHKNVTINLFLGLSSLILSHCSSLELASIRPTKAVTIDASTSDWPDSAWAEKDGLRFAVMNDDENAYVALVVVKPDLRRQIMFQGLTVWFDPLARGKKTVGVHYPLGMDRSSRRRGESDLPGQFSQSQSEFEYISPLEHGPVRVPMIAGRGIALRINSEQESVVYELRIPLRSSSDKPYSLESTPGAKISVGFEISGFGGGPGQSGGGPGEGSGGRGRGRASTGGAPARGTMTPKELVEVWATVQLATTASK